MDKRHILSWFDEECKKACSSIESSRKTPLLHKRLAFSLVMGVPFALTGCGEDPQLTAEQECEWEREKNGQWEIDCEDNNSYWYRSHGYASKHSAVHPSSPFYKSGLGSSGKKSGGFFSGG